MSDSQHREIIARAHPLSSSGVSILAAAAGLIPADHPQFWTPHDLAAAAARNSPVLAGLLQLVRESGRSAHPAPGQRVSDLVMEWSGRCADPMQVQALVDAYGRAIRA